MYADSQTLYGNVGARIITSHVLALHRLICQYLMMHLLILLCVLIHVITAASGRGVRMNQVTAKSMFKRSITTPSNQESVSSTATHQRSHRSLYAGDHAGVRSSPIDVPPPSPAGEDAANGFQNFMIMPSFIAIVILAAACCIPRRFRYRTVRPMRRLTLPFAYSSADSGIAIRTLRTLLMTDVVPLVDHLVRLEQCVMRGLDVDTVTLIVDSLDVLPPHLKPVDPSTHSDRKQADDPSSAEKPPPKTPSQGTPDKTRRRSSFAFLMGSTTLKKLQAAPENRFSPLQLQVLRDMLIASLQATTLTCISIQNAEPAWVTRMLGFEWFEDNIRDIFAAAMQLLQTADQLRSESVADGLQHDYSTALQKAAGKASARRIIQEYGARDRGGDSYEDARECFNRFETTESWPLSQVYILDYAQRYFNEVWAEMHTEGEGGRRSALFFARRKTRSASTTPTQTPQTSSRQLPVLTPQTSSRQLRVSGVSAGGVVLEGVTEPQAAAPW